MGHRSLAIQHATYTKHVYQHSKHDVGVMPWIKSGWGRYYRERPPPPPKKKWWLFDHGCVIYAIVVMQLLYTELSFGRVVHYWINVALFLQCFYRCVPLHLERQHHWRGDSVGNLTIVYVRKLNIRLQYKDVLPATQFVGKRKFELSFPVIDFSRLGKIANILVVICEYLIALWQLQYVHQNSCV